MMHSIRASLIKPFTKPFIKAGAKLICISLLFITQTAHADFRKALDAYQARDGATMLKEVKDAVGKKNDDGLILLISAMDIDYTTSRMTSFEPEATPQKVDLSKIKSTWETILTEAQQKEMFDMLDCATKITRVETRYKFIHSAIFLKYKWLDKTRLPYTIISSELETLAEKGSVSAAHDMRFSGNFVKSHKRAAQSGSALAAYELAADCYSGNPERLYRSPAECKARNEEKMAYWLQIAILNNDTEGWLMSKIAEEAGSLYQKGLDQQKPDAKEAYFWYRVALNTYSYSYYQIIARLEEMRKVDQLKQVAPLLDLNWDDREKRDQLLAVTKFSELPKWYAGRKKTIHEKPVFSYRSTSSRLPNTAISIGGSVDIDVYADGRVSLNFGGLQNRKENIETMWKISPQKVLEFMSSVKRLGVDDWLLNTHGKKACIIPSDCIAPIFYYITIREDGSERTLVMDAQDNTDISATYPNGKHIAQIVTLIEKYFPTQKLRCTLGSSQTYNQSCLKFDQLLFKTAQ